MHVRFALAPLAIAATVSLLVSACGGPPPAASPDTDAIVRAQAQWCSMLARVAGNETGWSDLDTCKAARPAGSASFIKLAAKCYEERTQTYGSNAPDTRLLADECKDEVVFKLPDDGGKSRFVLDARCERMARCEKVPMDECKGALDRLEPSQLSVFTTMFNLTALNEIKACLDGEDCTQDEDAMRTKCYEEASQQLLWFPL